jgi:hypothetical protein
VVVNRVQCVTILDGVYYEPWYHAAADAARSSCPYKTNYPVAELPVSLLGVKTVYLLRGLCLGSRRVSLAR